MFPAWTTNTLRNLKKGNLWCIFRRQYVFKGLPWITWLIPSPWNALSWHSLSAQYQCKTNTLSLRYRSYRSGRAESFSLPVFLSLTDNEECEEENEAHTVDGEWWRSSRGKLHGRTSHILRQGISGIIFSLVHHASYAITKYTISGESAISFADLWNGFLSVLRWDCRAGFW